MKQRRPQGNYLNELEQAKAEIQQLKAANHAVLKFAQANMERADQQQQILQQHERRIEMLEAYIRGQYEQN